MWQCGAVHRVCENVRVSWVWGCAVQSLGSSFIVAVRVSGSGEIPVSVEMRHRLIYAWIVQLELEAQEDPGQDAPATKPPAQACAEAALPLALTTHPHKTT